MEMAIHHRTAQIVPGSMIGDSTGKYMITLTDTPL
jgi:hypothetical protein